MKTHEHLTTNCKTALQKLLRKCIVKVAFVKKNGDTRIMFCTTNRKFIENDGYKPCASTHRAHKTSNENVIVWDIEKHAFRSFICDNLLDWYPAGND